MPKLFLKLFLVLILTLPGLAQTPIWKYVTTSVDGSKFYISADQKLNQEGHVMNWGKTLLPTGISYVSLSEWNCADNYRRFLKSIYYSEKGGVLKVVDAGEWHSIVPDSVIYSLYEKVCFRETLVEKIGINGRNTALRANAGFSASIIRHAQTGEVFEIARQLENTDWYNVVEPQTQKDYWVTEKMFIKVISGTKSSDIKRSKNNLNLRRKKKIN